MSRYDRCSYTHDVSDGDVFSDFDDDEWRCPHHSHSEAKRCIFHIPPDELELTDEAVARRFSWVVNGEARDKTGVPEADRQRYIGTDLTTEERKQYIGVEFGDLRPPVMELATAEEFRSQQEETPLDLRESTVHGAVDFSRVNVPHAVYLDNTDASKLQFDGAVIGGEARFRGAAPIESDVSFTEATIRGSVDFRGVHIQGNAEFREVVVEGSALFRQTRVGRLDFMKAQIEGLAEFSETVFNSVSFADATVESAVWFVHANVGGDARFTKATIEGNALFKEMTVAGEASFDQATFEGIVSFEHTEVDFSMTLENSTFRDDLTLRNVTIHNRLSMRQCVVDTLALAPVLTHPAISVVDVTGSHVKNGTFAQPDDSQVFYDLADATLGNVAIKGGESPAYRYARIKNTEFSDFDFEEEREKLNSVEWKLYTLVQEEDGVTRNKGGWAAFAAAAEFESALGIAVDLRDLLCDAPNVATKVDDDELSVRALPDELDDFPAVGIIDDDGVRDAVASLASRISTLTTEEYDPTEETQATTERVPYEERTSIDMEFLTTALAEAMSDEAAVRPSPSEREATQRNAKTAARDAGVEPYAANFYIWEMRNRRSKYAAEALHPDTDDSTVDRLRAAYSWLGNKLLDLTTVYGERTNRVVVVSLGWVGLFAVIYRLLEAPAPTGSGWEDYLLFSFQSFIAFILGGAPQTSSFSIQFASAIEGFTGGFFVALFVFALTRSVQR